MIFLLSWRPGPSPFTLLLLPSSLLVLSFSHTSCPEHPAAELGSYCPLPTAPSLCLSPLEVHSVCLYPLHLQVAVLYYLYFRPWILLDFLSLWQLSHQLLGEFNIHVDNPSDLATCWLLFLTTSFDCHLWTWPTSVATPLTWSLAKTVLSLNSLL